MSIQYQYNLVVLVRILYFLNLTGLQVVPLIPAILHFRNHRPGFHFHQNKMVLPCMYLDQSFLGNHRLQQVY